MTIAGALFSGLLAVAAGLFFGGMAIGLGLSSVAAPLHRLATTAQNIREWLPRALKEHWEI